MKKLGRGVVEERQLRSLDFLRYYQLIEVGQPFVKLRPHSLEEGTNRGCLNEAQDEMDTDRDSDTNMCVTKQDIYQLIIIPLYSSIIFQ